MFVYKLSGCGFESSCSHLKFIPFTNHWSSISSIQYQQDSRVLYTFIPNKLFGQLQDILRKTRIFKDFNSDFSFIEYSFIYLWFTVQNSKPLEAEDKNIYI